jgi:hypothetical protein
LLALSAQLEQNQSKRALDESLKGGFFLRKKPLEGIASGYSYSGFAIGHNKTSPTCGVPQAQKPPVSNHDGFCFLVIQLRNSEAATSAGAAKYPSPCTAESSR